ncbi:MAG: esterase-like activity of phytase family protein [Candidatus Dadabacteria bacterium]|nr:MAG: esterase-like activity of phytase family protein [Candidatus Dadabacteria bacterium]
MKQKTRSRYLLSWLKACCPCAATVRPAALIFSALFLSCCGETEKQPRIDKYKIELSEAVKESTVIDKIPAIGSGLALKEGNSGSSAVFYSVADRRGRIAVTESSLPFFAEITLKSRNAFLTGLQAIYGLKNSDLEGIARDQDGKLWFCDEARQALYSVDPESGRMLKKLRAGKELPKYLKRIFENKGFEGVAVSPSNRLVTIMQGPLKVHGTGYAPFVRLITYDLKENSYKSYLYPINTDDYRYPSAYRISAIEAVSDSLFIALERGEAPSGYNNKIFTVDISETEPLPDKSKLKQLPEYQYFHNKDTFDEKYKDSFVKKRELIDLRNYGWKYEKSEGLAVLPDHKRIAVINDYEAHSPECLKNNGCAPELWIVELPKPLITKRRFLFWILLAGFFIAAALAGLYLKKGVRGAAKTGEV